MWKTFNLKTLSEYHDLYVKTDILLLVDIFQNFKKLCYQYYDNDLFTAPSLALQECIKMNDTPLELLIDIDKLLMIENCIPGGISIINRTYAEANNSIKYYFKDKQPVSYIMYWDANNLYDWAMSQSPLRAYGKFEWYATNHVSEE